MSEINYNTRFRIGQIVTISDGLYRGRYGKVIGYTPHTLQGLLDDNKARNLNTTIGLYTVKIGFFKTIYVQEYNLR